MCTKRTLYGSFVMFFIIIIYQQLDKLNYYLHVNKSTSRDVSGKIQNFFFFCFYFLLSSMGKRVLHVAADYRHVQINHTHLRN